MGTQDEEYEEEEFLVLVELSGIINDDFLRNFGTKCKLLGVETETPVLQFGSHVFKGSYDDVCGTAIILEIPESASTSQEPGISSSLESKTQEAPLKFYDITRKKLNMTRAFLTEKSVQCSE